MWASATPGPVAKADCLAALMEPEWDADAAVADRERAQRAALLAGARVIVDGFPDGMRVAVALSGHVASAMARELAMVRLESDGDVTLIHIDAEPALAILPEQ